MAPPGKYFGTKGKMVVNDQQKLKKRKKYKYFAIIDENLPKNYVNLVNISLGK